MPGSPILIQSLPGETIDRLTGLQIVELPMTADDRRRVRRLVQAPDGATLALELPTGTRLAAGQVLHISNGRAYVASAAPEDVLVVHPRDVAEAARVGHLIGNLHRDIDLQGHTIVALWDQALDDRLRRAGVPVERSERPFRGAPPAEHSH